MPGRNLVGFVHNPRVPKAVDLVAHLVNVLNLQQTSWVSSATDLKISDDVLLQTLVVITVGGDGTILRAVRLTAPHLVPILGINMGRVGFMSELRVKEAVERIPHYFGDGPRVEERMLLQVSVTSRSSRDSLTSVHALNDVVLTRGAVARLVDIEATIDGADLATYRADGVIVATATGSTGYALSAGGTILHPEARVMLIQPVAAHMSFQTGVIVPENSAIELRPSDGYEAVLVVDGTTETTLGSDTKIIVKCSPYRARFLRASPSSAFYSSLTERLGINGKGAQSEAKQ